MRGAHIRLALAALAAGALLLFVAGAPGAFAQGPPAEQTTESDTRAAERARLFAALARAQTEAEAKAVTSAIWQFWFVPPDAEAGALMDRAVGRIRRYDYAGAIEILDELVALAPEWAEAWNQRATVRFLRGNYEGSLADIERTLNLEPKHFGALAGQVIILMRQGRVRTAHSVLRRALRIHPFLAERRLLMPADREEKRI